MHVWGRGEDEWLTYHSGELNIPGEKLGNAVLDLVLSHELGSAEVKTLDLLGALGKIGPVEHGGLLGNTRAHLLLHTKTLLLYQAQTKAQVNREYVSSLFAADTENHWGTGAYEK